MNEIDTLKNDINKIREQLQLLIMGKQSLIEEEVLDLSKMLDEMLIKYERLTKP